MQVLAAGWVCSVGADALLQATQSRSCAPRFSGADRVPRAELKSKIAERTLAAMQRPDVKEKIARAVSRRQASVKAGPWVARPAKLQGVETFQRTAVMRCVLLEPRWYWCDSSCGDRTCAVSASVR